ncbi:MAG: YgiT-type zinc finger domain-containing protein [Syntrophus sp. (in: bacteria)]|nr:YgiT-type zinc finger domain-containing protein [Syntrophus sp. (in: bacteria)]
MGKRFKDKEKSLKCFQCSSDMEHAVTDLPFKVAHGSIVIIKNLPVWQCENCNEYLLEDAVMKGVDDLLSGIDSKVEVEILSYAV